MDPHEMTPVDCILHIIDPAELSYYPLGRPETIVSECNSMIYEIVHDERIKDGHSKEAKNEFIRALRRSIFQLDNIWIPRAEEIDSGREHDQDMVKIIAASLLKDATAKDLTYLLTLEFLPIYKSAWREKNKTYSEEEVTKLSERQFVRKFIASVIECHEWLGTILARISK